MPSNLPNIFEVFSYLQLSAHFSLFLFNGLNCGSYGKVCVTFLVYHAIINQRELKTYLRSFD